MFRLLTTLILLIPTLGLAQGRLEASWCRESERGALLVCKGGPSVSVTIPNDTDAPSGTPGINVVQVGFQQVQAIVQASLPADWAYVEIVKATSPGGSTSTVAKGKSLTALDQDIDFNVTYYYKARVVDTSGNAGAWSAEEPITISLPRVAAIVSGAGTVSVGATKTLDLAGTADYERGGAVMPAAGSDFIIPRTGQWSIGAIVAWETNSTGWRRVFIFRTNTTPARLIADDVVHAVTSPDVTVHTLSGVLELNVGDAIRFQATQDSGGDLDVNLLEWWAHYIGP
jgi:hypothetical protein